jgi:hypothetical protein
MKGSHATMKKSILPLVLVGAAALATARCGNNVQGSDATPVYLEANIGGAGGVFPLFVDVNSNAPLQLPNVVVSAKPKNPAALTSSFMDVVLEDYVVSWKRIDGGTVASPSELFTAFGTVTINGQNTLFTFDFMRRTSLQLPPLNQLFPFNGGIDRETNRAEIHQAMTVIFHGHTISGQAVTSNPAVFSTGFIFTPPAAISPVGHIKVSR